MNASGGRGPVESAGRGGYHHGSLREALTFAALELLDEGGLEALTVREAARRVGVSPGAPFRHFADRRALLRAVAAEVIRDFTELQCAALAEEVPGRPPTWALGRGFVRYAAAHPHRFELLRETVYGPRRDPELGPLLAGFEAMGLEAIAEGQRAGTLRPGDPTLVLLAGQALVYGLSQMIVDGFLPPEAAGTLTDQLLDTLAHGVARITEADNGPPAPGD
ncbi:TetR/AcrR family transcriptional regulator [Streptomyces sp. DSM 44917]|uniref:TetR/AcrR family transcriptional regulator n=1 Tax=Streptomyces boetiae TaxID=3075541 RepID=A0ABU2LD12_9ACTN|nr:TetR/AcrR family transcriptional regulator [Streptomyces sp. DSM 44917]MDT0309469.1 TetR/AcrR family transcriptional regulator [Streptomyces sp. DSM 44917]